MLLFQKSFTAGTIFAGSGLWRGWLLLLLQEALRTETCLCWWDWLVWAESLDAVGNLGGCVFGEGWGALLVLQGPIMATSANQIEQLRRRIQELEEELVRERGGSQGTRARIAEMSPEVTDSNPYRWVMAKERSGRRSTCEGGRPVKGCLSFPCQLGTKPLLDANPVRLFLGISELDYYYYLP